MGQIPYQRYGFISMCLCAAYFFDTCYFYISEKNLDPLSNSVYSPGDIVYKLIKDIKYKFQNSHTILMLLCVNNCL